MSIIHYNTNSQYFYTDFNRTGSASSATLCGSLGNLGSIDYISQTSVGSTNIIGSAVASQCVRGTESANSPAKPTIQEKINEVIEQFINGKISAHTATQRLKRLPGVGIKSSSIMSRSSTLRFTYNGTSYRIYNRQSDNKTSSAKIYAKTDLQNNGTINLSDSLINQYFNLIYEDSDGKTMYTIKPDSGYKTPQQLMSALFEQYKQDLILDNFLENKNKEGERAVDLQKLESGETLLATNFDKYAKEIGLATGEEAEKLRAEALDKLIKDYTSGNMNHVQIRDVLNAIGVETFERKGGQFITYSFTYDGKQYTLNCNMEAAKLANDDIVQATYTKDELLATPGADEILINNYFVAAASVDNKTTIYRLRNNRSFEEFQQDCTKKLWEIIDKKLQEIEEENNNSSIINSDSVSSTGGAKVDAYSKIENMTTEEYKNSILKYYTVDSDTISSNLSNRAISAKPLNSDDFNTMAQTVIKEVQQQIYANCEKADFPVDTNLLDTVLRLTYNNISVQAFVNIYISIVNKNPQVSYESFYKYYTEIFSDTLKEFINETKIEKTSKKSMYEVIADMPNSTYSAKITNSYYVKSDGIESQFNYNINLSLVRSERFAKMDSIADSVFKLIKDEIITQCYENNIPYDSELVSKAIKSVPLAIIENSCCQTVGVGKWRTITFNTYSFAQKLREYVNGNISRLLDTSKPKAEFIEYEYDPKSSLTESEQKVYVDVQNLIIGFMKIVANYPDTKISIDGGDFIEIKDLICYYYYALQDYSTFKELCQSFISPEEELEDVTTLKAVNQNKPIAKRTMNYDERDDYDELTDYEREQWDSGSRMPELEVVEVYPPDIEKGWDDSDIWADEYDYLRDSHPDWSEDEIRELAQHEFMVKNLEMQAEFYKNLNKAGCGAQFQYNKLLDNYVTKALSSSATTFACEAAKSAARFSSKYGPALRALAQKGGLASIGAGLVLTVSDLLNGDFEQAAADATSTLISCSPQLLILSLMPAPLEYQMNNPDDLIR